MRTGLVIALASGLLTTVIAALPALANWPALGREVTAAIKNQELPQVATDGVSGSGLAVSRRGPNPARGHVTLSFALPHTAAVRLAIFDVNGRRVRELVSGVESAGAHDVTWDLHDEQGQRLSAGICFARLDVEGHALSTKVVTVR